MPPGKAAALEGNMGKGRVHSWFCGVLICSIPSEAHSKCRFGIFFWKDDGKARDFEGRQQGFKSCFCHLNSKACFPLLNGDSKTSWWEACKHGLGYVKCLAWRKCSINVSSFFWERSAFWIFCRLAGGVKIFACGHFPREKQGCITSCYSLKAFSLSQLFWFWAQAWESCSVCVQCGDGGEAAQAFAKVLDLWLPRAVQNVWRTWSG